MKSSRLGAVLVFMTGTALLGVPATSPAAGTVERLAFESWRGAPAQPAGIYVSGVDGTGAVKIIEGGRDAAWSPDGSKIAYSSFDGVRNQIYFANNDGSGVTRVTNSTGHDRFPSWSPDGTKLVFMSDRDGGNNEIYSIAVDGSQSTRLTDNSAVDQYPRWSPDGAKIAFASTRGGILPHIYSMNVDGSSVTQLTTVGINSTPAWSPDGTKIALAGWRWGSPHSYEIVVMDAGGSNQIRLTESLGSDSDPAWSPDGTKIAFISKRDGDEEIFVINADGTGLQQVTQNTENDRGVSWARLPSCFGSANPAGDEAGPVSGVVHDTVEPAIEPLAQVLHDVNCSVVVPAGL